jgi:hypothetical protein
MNVGTSNHIQMEKDHLGDLTMNEALVKWISVKQGVRI